MTGFVLDEAPEKGYGFEKVLECVLPLPSTAGRGMEQKKTGALLRLPDGAAVLRGAVHGIGPAGAGYRAVLKTGAAGLFMPLADAAAQYHPCGVTGFAVLRPAGKGVACVPGRWGRGLWL